MKLIEIKDYLTDRDKRHNNESIAEELKNLKEIAISQKDEGTANEIWCLEQINKIHCLYLEAFNLIKGNDHYQAWCVYERIDILLAHLDDHFKYENNEYDLLFIEKYTSKLTKLFPYTYFMSREAVIKKSSCSICGKRMSIRNHCEHQVGKLYMGKLCCKVVGDIKFKAIAIVKNPVDKYAVIFPNGKEYNYFMLDQLFDNLKSPYDLWSLNISEVLKEEYKGVGRNSKCPCGSGKKYKNCCKETKNELTDHYKISFPDNENVKKLPYTQFDRWV